MSSPADPPPLPENDGRRLVRARPVTAGVNPALRQPFDLLGNGYFTARQVTVLKTPSIFWILSTISDPIELTSAASQTAMTSYSPVIASAAVIPLTPSIFFATSSARPGDALIRTYAFIR